jgi:hypothetical protein
MSLRCIDITMMVKANHRLKLLICCATSDVLGDSRSWLRHPTQPLDATFPAKFTCFARLSIASPR